MSREIHTIGYSSYSLEEFLATLARHGITLLVDVRSQPYSRYKSEFNRESLKNHLAAGNIAYLFLGDQCGARPDAPECYVNGKVDFNLVKNNGAFQVGLERLRKEVEQNRVVLMCAEKDPLTCHRTILVARHLADCETPIHVKHILDGGALEDHGDAENRLLAAHHLEQPDLFRSRQERLDEAYERQGAKIAHAETDDPVNEN